MIAHAAHHKVGLAQALGTLEGRSGVVSFLFFSLVSFVGELACTDASRLGYFYSRHPGSQQLMDHLEQFSQRAEN